MKLPVSAICVILLLISCKGDRNKPYRIPDLPQKTGDQPAVVDSLIRQLRQNDLHDTSRAKSMMTLAINYETVDSTLADQTYQQGIQFSKSKDLHFFTGMLYHNKAYFYWTNGSREKALVYMDSAQYYMEKSDHPKRDLNIAATWGITANIWREMGDYKKAIEYGYKAIRMYEKIGAIYDV